MLPVIHDGELKMYNGCAIVQDWESGMFLYLRREQRILERVSAQRASINVAREREKQEVTTRVHAS